MRVATRWRHAETTTGTRPRPPRTTATTVERSSLGRCNAAVPIPVGRTMHARHDGCVSDERAVWKVTAMIEATAEQAKAAQEAIARALCPDEDHPGYCATPWTLIACRFEDLTDEERAAWEANFDEERTRAPEAGEPRA